MTPPSPTPVVVPVYFDYASTLCCVAWRLAGRLETEMEVRFRWRPVHIAAQASVWPAGTPMDAATRTRLLRVAQETAVRLRIPERWLDSRAALEGAFFADTKGCSASYHEAVFTTAYENGGDIANRAQLVCAAQRAGLPAGEFMEWIATRRGASLLAAAGEEALQLGVSGYPTFLLGEFPLTGIHPVETMRLLLVRHLQRRRRETH